MKFEYQLNFSMLRGLFGLLIFTGNDRVLEGQAAYRLGQAYDKIGEGETALEVFTLFLYFDKREKKYMNSVVNALASILSMNEFIYAWCMQVKNNKYHFLFCST